MVRSSRLIVCLAMLIRNASHIHWHRSMIRQRTTPCIAGIGPLSITPIRAARDHVIQAGWLAGRLAVDQPFGATGVKLQYPVPDDLQRHPVNLGGLCAGRSVIYRSQRK